jgi:hypothetical protein
MIMKLKNQRPGPKGAVEPVKKKELDWNCSTNNSGSDDVSVNTHRTFKNNNLGIMAINKHEKTAKKDSGITSNDELSLS